MDAMAWLATQGTSRWYLGGPQVECQSVLTGQQIVTIEMKPMKLRQQALKQFHE